MIARLLNDSLSHLSRQSSGTLAGNSVGHVSASACKAKAGGANGLAGHVASDEMVGGWILRCSLKCSR